MSISIITQNNNHPVSLPGAKKGLNVNIDNLQKVDQLLEALAQTVIRSGSSEESMKPYIQAESVALLKTDSGSEVDLPALEEPRELQFHDRGLQDSFIRRVIGKVRSDSDEDDNIELDDELRYINQQSRHSYTTYDTSQEEELSEATTPKLEEQEQEFPVSPTVLVVHPNGFIANGKVVCSRDQTS